MTRQYIQDPAARALDAPEFPLIVSEWDRNSREVLRVELDQYRGSKIISIRSWYRCGDDLRPSKSGITIAARHTARLAEALALAVDMARATGIAVDPVDATNTASRTETRGAAQ